MNHTLKIDFPDFAAVLSADIKQQVSVIIEHNQQQLSQLLDQQIPTWDNFIIPFAELENSLHSYWSTVSHLHAVLGTDKLKQAYKETNPLVVAYYVDLSTNYQLYQTYQQLLTTNQQLSAEQRKYLTDAIRDFKLAGVELDLIQKQQLQQLQLELSDLSNNFQENVLAATQQWQLLLPDTKRLAGLPNRCLQEAQALATSNGKVGYLFNLEYASFIAIMRYSHDRELRRQLYTAYTTRASFNSELAPAYDNSEIMVKIMQRRQQLAELLGFNSYAEYSIQDKMVTNTKQVFSFLQNLLQQSINTATAEMQELTEFAAQDGIAILEPFDIEYYRELYRKQYYDLSQDELRNYFPVTKVLSGIAAIVNKLFALEVTAIKQPGWDPLVQLLEVSDHCGIRGYIYLDLYARDNKRGGAWMDECRNRFVGAKQEVNCPIAYLTCNFSRPIANQPTLLSHEELLTLLHEFGHCLHHVVTKVDTFGLSGINGVPWDAVEFPSQFLENWAWDYSSLQLCSEHYQTLKPLPKDLFNKLLATKNFHSGMAMLRQLEFALFDFQLHNTVNIHDEAAVQTILNQVRADTSVIPITKDNKFQHSFSHIFAGGYAAGYYSYKWAEVLACDAFSIFLEHGIFNQLQGQRFLNEVLSMGGSADINQLFVNFRGRQPDVGALLQQSGIVSS